MRRIVLFILLSISVSAFWWLRTEEYEFLRIDDLAYVTENTHVQGGLTVPNITWAFANVNQGNNWHPLTWTSLMLDASLAPEKSLPTFSRIMHRHNAILQGISAAFLFLLMTMLAARIFGKDSTSRGSNGVTLAICACLALVWALHPLRAEVVCWVTERKELLCTVLGLATMILWLSGRTWLTACAVLLYVAALLSKSVAVTIPVALIAFDFIGCTDGDWRRVIRRRMALWGILFAFGAVAAYCTVVSQAPAIKGNQDTALWIRIFNGFGAYAVHARNMFFPVGLYFHHPFVDHVEWMPFAVGIVFIICAVGATWKFFRSGCKDGTYAAIGFLAAAWCIVGLTPMCGVLRVGIEMNPDRFGHWVGTGLTACISLALLKFLEHAGSKLVRCIFAVLLVLVAVTGFAGWNYGAFFRNNFTLFSRTVACKPDHPQALSHVGSEYAVRFNRPDLAIECYERSIAAFPSDDVGGQLATVLATRGNPADFPRVKQLCAAVIKDRTLDESGLALGALGMVAMYEHRWDEAASYLRDSAARQKATGKPTEDTWMRVAMCHYNAKDYEKAKPILSSLAVSRNPAIKAKAIELIGYIIQKERPSVFR